MSGRVVSWILGGLGNQMFQYAAGLATARRRSAELLLDRSQFSRYPLRTFDLQTFAIPVQDWHGTSPAYGWQGKLLRKRQALANRGWLPHPRLRVVMEAGFHAQAIPDDPARDLYLWGFWQSPRYFADIADEVHRVFDPGRFATPELPLAEVERPGSVSVHVRRGDYATNPETLRTHGLLDDAWYRRACGLLRQAVSGCQFHVISDDPAAAAAIFAGQKDVTVHPRRSQEQDLLLMSRCQHHIIANSSFSWWAAWLGQHPDGLTVAPRRWFARDTMLRQNTVDLFPEPWITL